MEIGWLGWLEEESQVRLGWGGCVRSRYHTSLLSLLAVTTSCSLRKDHIRRVQWRGYKARQWIFIISTFPLFLAHLSLPSLPLFSPLSPPLTITSFPPPPLLLSYLLPCPSLSLLLHSTLSFLSPPPLHPQTGKTGLTCQ